MVDDPKTSKKGEILRPPTDDGGGKGGGGGGPGFVGSPDDGGSGCCDIPAAPNPDDFYADQLTLYGIKLNLNDRVGKLQFVDKVLNLDVRFRKENKPAESDEVSIAVVYAYSFEGQCYRLERPRIFVIDSKGKFASGCGFSKPYFMWNIAPRVNLLEISTSYDTAEVLILDANLPGNRAPNTYGNHMKLAHRNGKLNRPGGP